MKQGNKSKEKLLTKQLKPSPGKSLADMKQQAQDYITIKAQYLLNKVHQNNIRKIALRKTNLTLKALQLPTIKQNSDQIDQTFNSDALLVQLQQSKLPEILSILKESLESQNSPEKQERSQMFSNQNSQITNFINKIIHYCSKLKKCQYALMNYQHQLKTKQQKLKIKNKQFEQSFTYVYNKFGTTSNLSQSQYQQLQQLFSDKIESISDQQQSQPQQSPKINYTSKLYKSNHIEQQKQHKIIKNPFLRPITPHSSVQKIQRQSQFKHNDYQRNKEQTFNKRQINDSSQNVNQSNKNSKRSINPKNNPY